MLRTRENKHNATHVTIARKRTVVMISLEKISLENRITNIVIAEGPVSQTNALGLG